MNDLSARLLAAHERGDKTALVALYGEAAERAETQDAAGFFLTHAYVYALDKGLGVACELRAKLVAMGRED